MPVSTLPVVKEVPRHTYTAVGGRSTRISLTGSFRLRESINFGFGAREARSDEPVMRMAFVGDGYTDHAAVAVTQPDSDHLDVEFAGAADPDEVLNQVARVLSVDVDASGWDALGRRDDLIGRLHKARPGLRPPLFYSAYEAAAWALLSARRPRQQMAAVRNRLSQQHGRSFHVAGERVDAFPTPEQLLTVNEFGGIPAPKLARLHALAGFALDGGLDTDRLRALEPAQAVAHVTSLNGIGPVYASLIVIRALGHTDVLPSDEALVLGILGQILGRRGPVAQSEFDALAQSWTPWRTWAAVALRAAGPSLLARPRSPHRPAGVASRARSGASSMPQPDERLGG